MNKEKRSVIIISASSDIGIAMCNKWKSDGWDVYGTYRTRSEAVEEMEGNDVKLVHCDLSSNESTKEACSELRKLCPEWDALILAPGAQDPVGAFLETDFDEWAESVDVNFTNQLRTVYELMQTRNLYAVNGPLVLFFAGGGTNNATVNYSAYTISKIGLIKMCELLDAEIEDTRFSIVGPGWVKTKIHDSTIKAKEMAGANYEKTIEKLASDECTPMEDVLGCCEWIIDSPREVVSGRNLSVVFDKWGTPELEKMLTDKFDMYKLRRFGNDFLA